MGDTSLRHRITRRVFLRRLGGSIVLSGTLGGLSSSVIGRTANQVTEDGRVCADWIDATFRGLNAMVKPEDETGLPYDIVNAVTLKPEDRIGADDPYKTTPLEIGLYLAGLMAQVDLGLMGESQALAMMNTTLGTLQRDQASQTIPFTDPRGQSGEATFPYLWLDPRTGAPSDNPDLQTDEIPAIDNAQLGYTLAALTVRFPDTVVARRAQTLLDGMDFRLFEMRQEPSGQSLLSQAYRCGRLIDSKIDIWGSEGIVAALLGVVKDGVAQDALPHPDQEPGPHRVRYRTAGEEGRSIHVIPVFGGSLFTALFPLLFWGTTNVPKPILENARRHVEVHQAEAKRLGLDIWGWAPAQDGSGAYHVYGVPEVSKFFEPRQEAVAAYASGLALNLQGFAPADPIVAATVDNLTRYASACAGAYTEQRGFADSVHVCGDWAAGNLLALDKGMEAVGLYNRCRRVRGRPNLTDYVWTYFDRLGKADLAQRLLSDRGEEIAQILEL